MHEATEIPNKECIRQLIAGTGRKMW